MRLKIALAAAGIIGLASSASAQDAVIGVTAALTGPPASTYAPAVRSMLDGVNERGGINGKKIKLVVQDDSAEPSKAVANVKKLVSQDNAILLINASLSSTYAPVIAESRASNTPLLFASGVCPKEVYPPANPLQFCTTAYASTYDSRAALTFVKDEAKGAPVKIGFSAMAIPLSRGEMDFAAKLAPEMGMTVASTQVIPPPTPDYTPFATKLLEGGGVNWVFSWAPWVTEVRTFEALRRLGWQSDYLAWAHLEAEGELKRIKDPKLFVIGANALFDDQLPEQKVIAEAAKKAGSKYPPDQMVEGWIAGMVIEAALKGAGDKITAESLRNSMSNLKVDLKGLRGGPIEWTKDNHFRTKQYYRVYRWDPAKGKIVVAKDWYGYDVK
jgi:branched-chain amino acid transport system substrate-binding protein